LSKNIKWYKKGLKDGIPIALGYFAVSFALGIAAKKAGLSAFEAMLAAGLTNASAGAYAGFTLIAEQGGYIAMALSQLIVNARYLLMSCALSQKLNPKTSLFHRAAVAFDVTDEIFGISVNVKGELNPFYNYGAMTLAIPGWAFGTFFGVLMGNVLPLRVVSALGVGLYGMFMAIIIPPAKENKIIAGLIAVSFISSFLFAKLPIISRVPSGMQVIILTIAISLFAAILFPIKDEEEEENA